MPDFHAILLPPLSPALNVPKSMIPQFQRKAASTLKINFQIGRGIKMRETNKQMLHLKLCRYFSRLVLRKPAAADN